MLGKLVNIIITRESDNLDTNNNYVKTTIYNWTASLYFSTNNRFVFSASQSEPKQEFIFNIHLWALCKIWDIIECEWIKSKINTLPKTIKLLNQEFIKITTEYIWS